MTYSYTWTNATSVPCPKNPSEVLVQYFPSSDGKSVATFILGRGAGSKLTENEVLAMYLLSFYSYLLLSISIYFHLSTPLLSLLPIPHFTLPPFPSLFLPLRLSRRPWAMGPRAQRALRSWAMCGTRPHGPLSLGPKPWTLVPWFRGPDPLVPGPGPLGPCPFVPGPQALGPGLKGPKRIFRESQTIFLRSESTNPEQNGSLEPSA